MIVLDYHTFTPQDLYFMNFLLYKTPLSVINKLEKLITSLLGGNTKIQKPLKKSEF